MGAVVAERGPVPGPATGRRPRLADVAARAGFADQAHLTRHFKRVVGVPPRAYQRARETAAGKNVQDRAALAT